MPALLFVCTANRFRSPIAEACFKHELVQHQLQAEWRVSSAGTWAQDGLPAIPDAITDAERLGLDIRGHRSSVITTKLISQANLIIVMEQGQKEALRNEFPESGPKTHLLSEVARGISYDIPDPVLSPSADKISDEICWLIHNGFERICALAEA